MIAYCVFSLFVEKNEIWRDKGEQKSTFTSPIIDFYISGKDDQIIEADNIDFEYSENYNLSDVTETNSDGWNIKQYTKNFTIKLIIVMVFKVSAIISVFPFMKSVYLLTVNLLASI